MLGGKLEQKWRMKILVIFSFQTGKSGYSVNVSGRILDFFIWAEYQKRSDNNGGRVADPDCWLWPLDPDPDF